MNLSGENIKIVFGLKAKQNRIDLGLTLQELGKKSGLSASYLNEIEKGKKYPKPEKISMLAEALETTYEEMVSLKLEKRLAPIGALLDANILGELPLEMFGVDASKVISILSEAPSKVNAFVSTILELARNNELRQEHFFHTALRSYQEINYNYFGDIEKLACDYRVLKNLPLVDIDEIQIKQLLIDDFSYQFKNLDIKEHPELQEIRSVFVPEKGNILFINPNLTAKQRLFLLTRELGFNVLGISKRPLTFAYVRVNSFDELHNNFRASYFSVALLIDAEELISDLRSFFSQKKFFPELLDKILNKYNASPEMLFHRMTSILPKYFNIKSLFFLRFNNPSKEDYFFLSKELHLTKKHNPHGNRIREHYCRRWVALGVLKDLSEAQKGSGDGNSSEKTIIRSQISKYIGSSNEYLCFSIAKPMAPTQNMNSSVTIGLEVNAVLRRKIAFLNDLSIVSREVNSTCERCPAENCAERVAEPFVIRRRAKKQEVDDALDALSSSI